MSIHWPIGNKHKVFGKVVSHGAIAGEPYRWFKGLHGGVRIIPLTELAARPEGGTIAIETKITEIVADCLEVDSQDLRAYDDLVQIYNIDALDYLLLEVALEDEFHIKFACPLIRLTKTVQQIIDYTVQKTKMPLKRSTLDVY